MNEIIEEWPDLTDKEIWLRFAVASCHNPFLVRVAQVDDDDTVIQVAAHDVADEMLKRYKERFK